MYISKMPTNSGAAISAIVPPNICTPRTNPFLVGIHWIIVPIATGCHAAAPEHASVKNPTMTQ
mgnify:CR=1 FL=1